MSLRTFSAALAAVLPLAGCSGAPAASAVWCARGGGPLAPVCAVERDGAGALTVRFPDGGFRRLLVGTRGVVAADGAMPAWRDGATVRVGGDRLRWPLVAAR